MASPARRTSINLGILQLLRNQFATMANEKPAMEVSAPPIELSFPMPKAPDTRIHIQLTIRTTSLLIFLTTALNGDISTKAPLGSFVYALPNVNST